MSDASPIPLPRAVTEERVAELADLFRLMGDATRLRIILSCLGGPASVGEIAARSGASASLVSHHLRLLRAARLVRAERRGRQIFYSPRDEHIRCVIEDMVAHVGEPREIEEVD
ncbi:MAG TPA: metalloregulator ArsR/SmtB family transcription factor [Pseudomonadales bacterium]